MAATNPLSSLGSGSGADSTSKLSSRFSDMSSEDFIKIIFTELSNQDPFQPNDSAALLKQLDSIRSIESDVKMTDQLKALVTQNQLAAGSGMIGKFIGGLTEDNHRVAGQVVSVVKKGENVNLELDNGWVVPMNGVEQVIDGLAPAASAPASA